MGSEQHRNEHQHLPPQRKELLEKLLKKMGVSCNRLDYLDQSLTHSSFSSDHPGFDNYERLEFFGDSVFKFVVSEYLYENFPSLDEGNLTEIRSVLVSGKTLEQVAKQLDLDDYIRFGRGATAKPSIRARAMEATLGALYLDSGFTHVRKFINEFFCKNAADLSKDAVKENYKAQLQQITQSRAQGIPVYSVVNVTGPPHDPYFSVEVSVADQVLGNGGGRSKKAAEQAAAQKACDVLLSEKNGQS